MCSVRSFTYVPGATPMSGSDAVRRRSTFERSSPALRECPQCHDRVRPTRWSGPPLAVVDGPHLFLAPGDRLVERHTTGCVLREHVGDDVEIPNLLRGRGGWTRPGWRYRDL